MYEEGSRTAAVYDLPFDRRHARPIAKGIRMGNISGIVALVAVTALCAIVGIYYCWVRKLGRSDKGGETQQPGTPR
jgi:hypothetical protein